MAVEDSVAQDQLRAFVERIERMEEEKAAIAADIKEIYAEAKGNGFDTKILRKIVTIRKQDANERAEQEAILDLYMGALGMAPMPLDESSIPDLSSIDPDLLVNLVAGVKTEAGRKIIMTALETVKAGGKADPRVAALRADPAMSIVDVSNLKTKSNLQDMQSAQTIPAAAEAQRSTPVDHVGSSGEAPIQSAPQAGSDLTEAPAYDQGQVAPIPLETANDAETECAPVEPCSETHGEANGLPLKGKEGDTPSRPIVGDRHDGALDVGGSTQREDRASPAPSLPEYAEPGVIVWETTPPEGVERGAISMAFGTMGQDNTIIKDDMANASSAPIVKKGKLILDGWARFMRARDLGTEYPVVQYAGSDILTDIIKLNVEGRILSEDQKRKIAASLARQEPSRKDDIYRAFELWMEPA